VKIAKIAHTDVIHAEEKFILILSFVAIPLFLNFTGKLKWRVTMQILMMSLESMPLFLFELGIQ
jgi:hypothetical protein